MSVVGRMYLHGPERLKTVEVMMGGRQGKL
jgi:hypothetical protein